MWRYVSEHYDVIRGKLECVSYYINDLFTLKKIYKCVLIFPFGLKITIIIFILGTYLLKMH